MADAFDRAIALIAGRQWGYITRAQLLAVGLSPSDIKYRVAIGRLIPLHAGVYAVGYVNRTPVARACAVVLACGDRAALSYGSAATLWGFNHYWDEPFEVTVAGACRRRAGIRVHRSRVLLRRDVTIQLGIRVTSPARTALDIAPRLSDKRLTRVVNDGLRGPHLHRDDLADVLVRNPTHPGARRLRRLANVAMKTPTNSPLEDDFLAFAKRYNLPKPVTDTYLLGYEIDVLYPEERVIVELDGYEFHSDRDSFERDRERDVVMLAADYVTVRITKRRMRSSPVREAARLNDILQARRRAA
jgi:very-short-patch-repair endonuclease